MKLLNSKVGLRKGGGWGKKVRLLGLRGVGTS